MLGILAHSAICRRLARAESAVLLRAEEDWCRDYQRLSVQHPLEHEQSLTSDREASGPCGLLRPPCWAYSSLGNPVLLVSARAAQWAELMLLITRHFQRVDRTFCGLFVE